MSHDIISEIRIITLENYENYTVLYSYSTDLLQYNDNVVLRFDTFLELLNALSR
jgi:hypothetical protein